MSNGRVPPPSFNWPSVAIQLGVLFLAFAGALWALQDRFLTLREHQDYKEAIQREFATERRLYDAQDSVLRERLDEVGARLDRFERRLEENERADRTRDEDIRGREERDVKELRGELSGRLDRLERASK